MLRVHCDFPAASAATRWRPPALAAAALVAAACAHAQASPPAAGEPAATQAGATVNVKSADAPPSRLGSDVTLDFANAEIDAVARTLATITGRNVVVDPRVKGTMTLTSTAPVSPDQALHLFAAQLRTQGFALVQSSGIYLVLPEADAKLQSGPVAVGAAAAPGGQIMTQIFRLTHENANNLVPVLRPLISPNNTINANAGTNAIVITDYADNLQRLGRIITALDVSHATGVEVVRLRYAVASDLAPLVVRLLEPGGGGAAAATPQPALGQPGGIIAAALPAGGGDGYRTTLVPEPRSNAIIVCAANPARLAQAINLIQQLDQPPSNRADGSSGNIHVVHLKNADATKLAVTLRAALAALPGQAGSAAAGGTGVASSSPAGGLSGGLSGGPSSSGLGMTGSGSSGGQSSLSGGPSINAGANNQPSTGGQIQADPATNSLIISAPEPVYRELRAAIDQLDQRRAQVFVESLIAEVNADRAADFGIQWQGLMGNRNNTIGVIGTNFSTPLASNPGASSTNIFNFGAQFLNPSGNSNSNSNGSGSGSTTPTQPVLPNTGFNLIAGSRALGLGVLANFIQSTGAGNVRLTPTLLTLDNEEARIVVGQNVPIVTGSYTTNTTGTGNVVGNPFQTYDRQNVGIMLRVRPQISEDGTIKMVIYQETSSVVAGTMNNNAGPVTNMRSIETSVLVDDGAIVVLGGLLEDNYSSSEDKVPVLGDVPLIGNLFKSRNRSYTKTNLMVFLRPVIVRDAAAAENYSLDRYQIMRAMQQSGQPKPSSVLQINEAPVLPPVTPVRPQALTRPAPPPPLIDRPAAGDSNSQGF